MANNKAVFKFDNLSAFRDFIHETVWGPEFGDFINNECHKFNYAYYYQQKLADPDILDFVKDYIYDVYQSGEYPRNRPIEFDLEAVVSDGVASYLEMFE